MALIGEAKLQRNLNHGDITAAQKLLRSSDPTLHSPGVGVIPFGRNERRENSLGGNAESLRPHSYEWRMLPIRIHDKTTQFHLLF